MLATHTNTHYAHLSAHADRSLELTFSIRTNENGFNAATAIIVINATPNACQQLLNIKAAFRAQNFMKPYKPHMRLEMHATRCAY